MGSHSRAVGDTDDGGSPKTPDQLATDTDVKLGQREILAILAILNISENYSLIQFSQ